MSDTWFFPRFEVNLSYRYGRVRQREMRPTTSRLAKLAPLWRLKRSCHSRSKPPLRAEVSGTWIDTTLLSTICWRRLVTCLDSLNTRSHDSTFTARARRRNAQMRFSPVGLWLTQSSPSSWPASHPPNARLRGGAYAIPELRHMMLKVPKVVTIFRMTPCGATRAIRFHESVLILI